MITLDVNLSDNDFTNLCERLDSQGKGYIDYNEFAQNLKRQDTYVYFFKFSIVVFMANNAQNCGV